MNNSLFLIFALSVKKNSLMRFLTLTVILLSCFSCSTKKQQNIEDKGEIFHTFYSVKYQYTHSLKEEIDAELLRFDNSLNVFNPSSVISKVNNNEAVVLDTFFINVFNRAQQVSALSDGLFDITISPMINAWGFGFKNMEHITPETIDSLRQLVGYDKIRLKDGYVEKENPKVQINASAIAKGYAVDVIAGLLDRHEIKNYMVEIGGEIRTKGLSPKGRCWNVGISMPMGKDIFEYGKEQAVVSLCNKAMATSGNYRNYYVKDGKKYAHTIDPTTGYPSAKSTLSATVIADDCMTADAYATAFMLADTSQVRQMAEKEAIDYMLVIGSGDSDYITLKSSRFSEYEYR